MRDFWVRVPLEFFLFWIYDVPIGLLEYFGSFNRAFLQLFSLPLLIRTYFKPWKNEYREGLVGFSIAMGMFIKTFVILGELVMLFFLVVVEAVFFVLVISLPVITVLILFIDPCVVLKDFFNYACLR